jgi:Flp pilus assembly protein TadD
MSKKNKPSKHRPAKGQPQPYRDLTADRFLTTQRNKIEKLFEQEEFEQAVDLLEPLTEKYPNRPEVFEMLGAGYVGLNFLEDARDAFEKALNLTPQPEALARFNLANLYAVTGFPLLAYQQTKLINRIALNRELEDGGAEAEEFLRLTEKVVDELAAENKKPRDRFLAAALPIERGQLALQRNEPAQARTFFLEAHQLDPASPVVYNSLALVDMVEGQFEAAIKQLGQALEIDPANLDTWTNLVRVNLMKGDRTEAEVCLDRVRVLSLSGAPGENIKMALAFAMLDHDQEVYNLLQPLLSSPDPLEELEGEGLEDAVILGAVAAMHLGRPDEARHLFEKIKEATSNLLLERTGMAFANGEEGPRPGGRLFYLDPAGLYSNVLERFRVMLEQQIEPGHPAYETEYRPFLAEQAEKILEMVTYQVWVTEEPEVIVALLTQIILAEVPGALELVKRLAFGQAGTEAQRLIIASSLIIAGVMDQDETVTIWLKGAAYTGTLSEIAQNFQKMEGLAKR